MSHALVDTRFECDGPPNGPNDPPNGPDRRYRGDGTHCEKLLALDAIVEQSDAS